MHANPQALFIEVSVALYPFASFLRFAEVEKNNHDNNVGCTVCDILKILPSLVFFLSFRWLFSFSCPAIIPRSPERCFLLQVAFFLPSLVFLFSFVCPFSFPVFVFVFICIYFLQLVVYIATCQPHTSNTTPIDPKNGHSHRPWRSFGERGD